MGYQVKCKKRKLAAIASNVDIGEATWSLRERSGCLDRQTEMDGHRRWLQAVRRRMEGPGLHTYLHM